MATQGTDQGDLFQAPPYQISGLVSDWVKSPPLLLVTCSKEKLKAPARAQELYTSERFQAARELAQTLGANWYIISGKHGLLSPDQIIEPYDMHLSEKSEAEIEHWAAGIVSALPPNQKRICILAEKLYSDPIVSWLARTKNHEVFTPLHDIAPNYHKGWVFQAISICHRRRDLAAFYDLLSGKRGTDYLFPLRNLSQTSLPDQGVYVFLNPNEENFRGESSRIVRIGTHAVSEGSKATLKERLNNHLGPKNGAGSHRGSVFRLHVGRAMLEQSASYSKLPSWGDGQNATAEVKAREAAHEARVSEYISKLDVFIIPASDAANKQSIRADIERQMIALCSQDYQCIDQPAPDWLGNWSTAAPIRRSGLWNVRDVAGTYDGSGRGSVREIIEILEG